MSLTDRHRWCMNKILEAFAPELTQEAAQAFMRNDANLQKFTSFFKGDGAGRLFVFYQAEGSEAEVRNYPVLLNFHVKLYLVRDLGPRIHLPDSSSSLTVPLAL